WEGWAILLRQKQKKLIMLPSETMIWQPEFTDKTLSRKPGAVHSADWDLFRLFWVSSDRLLVLITCAIKFSFWKVFDNQCYARLTCVIQVIDT
ncbi:hypothetical protein ACQX58_13470, partial [Salmonella enterica]|uniref:hypothetical protein n=1 Tax=Salmonella enterica TaxID=28901 RepID=UPI003D1C455D